MHQSSGKMMARARASLWWPFMARDISNHSKSCLPCEVNKDSNPAELILTHEPSQYPFQHLHMDIGQEQGYYYLISTCQFSGKTCTTEQVILVSFPHIASTTEYRPLNWRERRDWAQFFFLSAITCLSSGNLSFIYFAIFGHICGPGMQFLSTNLIYLLNIK